MNQTAAYRMGYAIGMRKQAIDPSVLGALIGGVGGGGLGGLLNLAHSSEAKRQAQIHHADDPVKQQRVAQQLGPSTALKIMGPLLWGGLGAAAGYAAPHIPDALKKLKEQLQQGRSRGGSIELRFGDKPKASPKEVA